MKHYELTYLISSDLSEEQTKEVQDRVASLIQEEGGTLNEPDIILRKKLAYPIKKPSVQKQQTEAFLVVSSFQLNPVNLISFEKKLKENPQILRYLILTKKERKTIKIAPRYAKKPKEEIREKKVELKEIEQKLEEILNEPR